MLIVVQLRAYWCVLWSTLVFKGMVSYNASMRRAGSAHSRPWLSYRHRENTSRSRIQMTEPRGFVPKFLPLYYLVGGAAGGSGRGGVGQRSWGLVVGECANRTNFGHCPEAFSRWPEYRRKYRPQWSWLGVALRLTGRHGRCLLPYGVIVIGFYATSWYRCDCWSAGWCVVLFHLSLDWLVTSMFINILVKQ